MNLKKVFSRTLGSRSILALLPVLLFLCQARAQEPVAKDTCRITVRQIVADNSGAGIASELKNLKKDLSKLSYSTFRLEQTSQLNLKQGELKTLDLLGGNRLELTLVEFKEKMIRIKVKLAQNARKERQFESVLGIVEGGTFLIAGPAYGEGVLFFAITARP